MTASYLPLVLRGCEDEVMGTKCITSRFLPNGGAGLQDLCGDALVCVLKKSDLQSLIFLGSADKRLRDFVREDQVWSDRCKIWEKEVDLVAWRAQMESSIALYRLLNSLSRLVGTWRHQSTDPRGEMVYVTWGNLAVEAWKVVPSSNDVCGHENEVGLPVTFVKFFQVVGFRDGSHGVELHSGEEGVDIVLPFPPPGNSFQLHLYRESDRSLTRNEVDEGSSGQSLGKRLLSVPHFGFSFSRKEDSRYARSRVYKRLTYEEPQQGRELAGLWHGFYGTHGCEVVTVSYTEDGLILGTKVLGDVNVPAGVATFKAYISTEGARRLSGKFYSGQGRIANEFFMNPQWVDGVLVTLAGGGFLFHWRPLFSSITFHRLDLDTLFRNQRGAVLNGRTTHTEA